MCVLVKPIFSCLRWGWCCEWATEWTKESLKESQFCFWRQNLKSSLCYVSTEKVLLPTLGHDVLSLATCMTSGRLVPFNDDLFPLTDHFVSSVPLADYSINLFWPAIECHNTKHLQIIKAKHSSGWQREALRLNCTFTCTRQYIQQTEVFPVFHTYTVSWHSPRLIWPGDNRLYTISALPPTSFQSHVKVSQTSFDSSEAEGVLLSTQCTHTKYSNSGHVSSSSSLDTSLTISLVFDHPGVCWNWTKFALACSICSCTSSMALGMAILDCWFPALIKIEISELDRLYWICFYRS